LMYSRDDSFVLPLSVMAVANSVAGSGDTAYGFNFNDLSELGTLFPFGKITDPRRDGARTSTRSSGPSPSLIAGIYRLTSPRCNTHPARSRIRRIRTSHSRPVVVAIETYISFHRLRRRRCDSSRHALSSHRPFVLRQASRKRIAFLASW
jgi:hypothetical protein